MKRIHLAALAAFAVTSTGALAAAGDAWYDTNRGTRDAPRATVDFGPREPERFVEVERDTAPAYVIVEREPLYTLETRDGYVVERGADPLYHPWHPQQGQRIERGLFNRKGPNDFGS